MKKVYLLLAICFISFNISVAQTDTLNVAQIDTLNIISEQIKNERDTQLKELSEKLRKNEEEVARLTEQLSSIASNNQAEKIKALEKLQIASDNRLKIIEEAPKTKISLNGQLAFIELLSIQRDLQPAELFLSSREFFTQLGNVGNLQNYNSFTNWKSEYTKWYNKQKNNDQMLELINSSINLIGNAANDVPLYGSIVQTVSSGVSAIVTSLGRKGKELTKKTPNMLKLLMVTSQFENQKAIIDHEWKLINKELRQLQLEDSILLKAQLDYYGLLMSDFKTKYLEETLDTKRDIYKKECRKKITDKLHALDSNNATKGKWLGQVETYMYKVQSLRLRFGQLTNRMLSNLDRYESLIEVYSDDKNFPSEFTTVIKGLGKSLTAVRKNFYTSFRPEKYIEDSAVMYIERQ